MIITKNNSLQYYVVGYKYHIMRNTIFCSTVAMGPIPSTVVTFDINSGKAILLGHTIPRQMTLGTYFTGLPAC